MMWIRVGSEGRRDIYGAHSREATGVRISFGEGCISYAKISIFTKSCLDLNEEEQGISFIKEKEKTGRDNISACFN